MKNNVNRKLEDENLEANGSSDVVAFGYSEMNESGMNKYMTLREVVAFGMEIEKVLNEIDDEGEAEIDDDESLITAGVVPGIRWKMVMPDEMAVRIEWPEDYRNLSLFEAIDMLPSLRGARIEIEGDFE